MLLQKVLDNNKKHLEQLKEYPVNLTLSHLRDFIKKTKDLDGDIPVMVEASGSLQQRDIDDYQYYIGLNSAITESTGHTDLEEYVEALQEDLRSEWWKDYPWSEISQGHKADIKNKDMNKKPLAVSQGV